MWRTQHAACRRRAERLSEEERHEQHDGERRHVATDAQAKRAADVGRLVLRGGDGDERRDQQPNGHQRRERSNQLN